MAFDPSKYTVAKARPLPVILLLDRSGSMAGEKISTLNSSINEMIESFKTAGGGEVDINLSVISFGDGGANYDLPLKSVKEISNLNLQANGMTPMGAALRMAKDLIEDKETIPSRSYRPLVILCSDGAPNDEWQAQMDNFIKDGRSSKCDRMAMAIGCDANEDVLKRFIVGTDNPLFYAKDASSLHKFFKFVTMSVTSRSSSQNPNQVLKIEPPKEIVESVDASSDTGSYW